MTTTSLHPPRLLKVQDHVLIAYTHKADPRPGSYGYGVALFAAPEGEWHRFVVWDVIDRPEGWACERGDYAQRLPEALEAYTLRDGEL